MSNRKAGPSGRVRARSGMTRRSRPRRIGAAGAGAGALAAGGLRLGPLGAAPARAQEPTEVTFWTPGGSPLYCETLTKVAADYGEVNPNVRVKFQCGTGEGFMERFLGSIAAGNPPEATILWDTPVSLGVQGALRALDDLMPGGEYTPAENWPPAVLASCQYGGQTWGLPVTAGTFGIWYNQELFEAKGIPSDRASFPKTWDELRALSKEFTQWEGDRLVQAGMVPFNEGGSLTPTLPIWSALNGSQLYDAANQRYTLDAEPNVAMLDFFLSWLDEEYQGDIAKIQRSGSWSPYPSDDGQPPQFQAGRLAMSEQGAWLMGDLYAFGDPVFTRWDVASYPVGPGGSGTTSGYWPNWVAIPNGTEYPEETFGYLDYLSGVGVVTWFAAVPDMPTNAKVPPVVPAVVVERRDQAFAEDVMAFFRGQLDVATPMWDSPVQSFAQTQLERALERVFAKQSTPQAALAEAQRACQAELEKVLAGGAG